VNEPSSSECARIPRAEVDLSVFVLKIIAHLGFKIYPKKLLILFNYHQRQVYPKFFYKKEKTVFKSFSQKTRSIFVISHHVLVCVSGLEIAFILGPKEYFEWSIFIKKLNK